MYFAEMKITEMQTTPIVPLALIALGATIAYFAYHATKNIFDIPEAKSLNYAKKLIPSVGGIVLLLAIVVCTTIFSLVHLFSDPKFLTTRQYQLPLSMLIILIGFAFIGLVDDVFGSKEYQGFKGHLKALSKGKITTGAIKLFGGPIIVLLALEQSSSNNAGLFLKVVAISLVANVFNLLDLAPGRTIKFALLALITSCFINFDFYFIYWIIGALVVMLWLDLKEKQMLGDVGANLLGAIVGFCLVLGDYRTTHDFELSNNTTTLIVIAIAFLLNLLSEFVSFSKIIKALPPLRFFDQLGNSKGR